MTKDKKYFELREMTELSFLAGDKDKALEKSKELDRHLNEKQRVGKGKSGKKNK